VKKNVRYGYSRTALKVFACHYWYAYHSLGSTVISYASVVSLTNIQGKLFLTTKLHYLCIIVQDVTLFTDLVP